MSHHARIVPTTAKRVWTKPVIEKLNPTEALARVIRSKKAARTIDQMKHLGRSAQHQG